MIKTQYSRVINKRSDQTGVVPTIGPSNDHTDGTWIDTDIYPGEFYINMEDQKVWFGWYSGSTSGVTQIYPLAGPGGGLTIVGGTGISVSGASPDFIIGLDGNTTEFSGLTASSVLLQLTALQTQDTIIILNTAVASAYARFVVSAIEETTNLGSIFECTAGVINDGTGWAPIGGSYTIFSAGDDIGFGTQPTFGNNGANDLVVTITSPAGTNTINYRLYWEYSLITT